MSEFATPDRRQHEIQAIVTVTTGAPVQNTWYPILTVTGAGMLHHAFMGVRTADETLEWELTLDGVLLGIEGEACTTDLNYEGFIWCDISEESVDTRISLYSQQNRKIDLPFKTSLLIRLRKTTALGAGNLTGMILYSLLK